MIAVLRPPFLPNNSAVIEIGGSKSESNRLLILQALYPNISIENLSDSDDTALLQKGLKTKQGTVDIGHAGTAMRFLTAYFAATEGAEVILTGSQRMQERPIGILVDALRSLGADITYINEAGYPPLRIRGKTLEENRVTVKADVSSQYISALMLIAPYLPNGLDITLEGEVASSPYIDMTLSILQQVGIEAHLKEKDIVVFPTSEIEDTVFTVESDWSSLSYYYSLIALSEKAELRFKHFSKENFQGDSVLKVFYEGLGVTTIFDENEDILILRKTDVSLPNAVFFDLTGTPDLAQTLAVTCLGLGIGCTLVGLQTLKIKETDRLVALKTELEKLGARVTITEESLQFEGQSTIKTGVAIDTYQDHRMAMAFAPLAAKVDLMINNAEVVTKSYPKFWEDWSWVGVRCGLMG